MFSSLMVSVVTHVWLKIFAILMEEVLLQLTDLFKENNLSSLILSV